MNDSAKLNDVIWAAMEFAARRLGHGPNCSEYTGLRSQARGEAAAYRKLLRAAKSMQMESAVTDDESLIPNRMTGHENLT
jgi:hypothetical protein